MRLIGAGAASRKILCGEQKPFNQSDARRLTIALNLDKHVLWVSTISYFVLTVNSLQQLS
jgi:hypothetical protein